MHTTTRVPLLLVLFAATVLFAALKAEASVLLGFRRITSNANSDLASQFRVEVGSHGLGTGTGGVDQIYFKFFNLGPTDSVISQIYFDDGTLLGLATNPFTSSAGVNFVPDNTPGNLPGGNTILFNKSGGYYAEVQAVNPAHDGIRPNEWLKVIYDLQPTKTYNSTVAAINLSLAKPNEDVVGGLRIGLHVQSIFNGPNVRDESDSFVNTGIVPQGPVPSTVPEPTSVAVYSVLGMIGLVASRFRLRRKSA